MGKFENIKIGDKEYEYIDHYFHTPSDGFVYQITDYRHWNGVQWEYQGVICRLPEQAEYIDPANLDEGCKERMFGGKTVYDVKYKK